MSIDHKVIKINTTISQMRTIWSQYVDNSLFKHDEGKIRDLMSQNSFHRESTDIDRRLMSEEALSLDEVNRLCDRQLFIFRATIQEAIGRLIKENKKTR